MLVGPDVSVNTTGIITASSFVGTALSISGISTLGTVKISSGIITATTGIVTYLVMVLIFRVFRHHQL
jgi:hypothetical protein